MRLPGRAPAPPELDDDVVRRHAVRRYAYNPVRHERRQVVAVLGTRRAFERELDRTRAELAARRTSGEDVDPQKHRSGVVLEPGYRRRAANGRLVRRAVEHGVWPAGLERLELPGSVAVFDR